ncbi:putative Sister chromatid cohesion protein DCC1 [Paratrimastix pyriformis]|uniref:Sister chromatid cohesion protein DCC1 n=1 Tax=Paratrimastix pyriformis TaxID=342808 RepID=A0ABQ8UM11_9EUKA|nr:putative Sister chromatid cohesion protein DCC1 [Paratrimastix pyriformis]
MDFAHSSEYSIVFGDTYTKGSNFRLFEVSEALLAEFAKNEVVIKGTSGEEATVCTSNKTFSVRRLDSSNLTILLDTAQSQTVPVDPSEADTFAFASQAPSVCTRVPAVGNVSCLYEMRPTIPRFERMHQLLEATAFKATTTPPVPLNPAPSSTQGHSPEGQAPLSPEICPMKQPTAENEHIPSPPSPSPSGPRSLSSMSTVPMASTSAHGSVQKSTPPNVAAPSSSGPADVDSGAPSARPSPPRSPLLIPARGMPKAATAIVEGSGGPGSQPPPTRTGPSPPAAPTLEDLEKVAQASRAELLQELRRIGAFEHEGSYWVLDRGLEFDTMDMLLDVVVAEGMPLDAVPYARCCAALPETAPVAILQVLRKYGHLKGSVPHPRIPHPTSVRSHHTFLCFRAEECGDTYSLPPASVAAFRAEQILQQSSRMMLDEFMTVWAQCLPPGVEAAPTILKGIAVVDGLGAASFVRYLPASRLPLEPGARFAKLFTTREKWTHDEIDPYLQDLLPWEHDLNALLGRYTRFFRNPDGKDRAGILGPDPETSLHLSRQGAFGSADSITTSLVFGPFARVNQQLTVLVNVSSLRPLSRVFQAQFTSVILDASPTGMPNETWTHVAQETSFVRDLRCDPTTMECGPAWLFTVLSLDYPYYRVHFTMTIPGVVGTLGAVGFEQVTAKASFTWFELFMRYWVFFCVLLVLVAFYYAMRPYAIWFEEQKWTALLLWALLCYVNPFWGLHIVFQGAATVISYMLSLYFLTILFLAWLVLMGNLVVPFPERTKRFWMPRLMLAIVFFAVGTTVAVWARTNPPFSNIYHDRTAFWVFACLLGALLTLYAGWLAVLLVRVLCNRGTIAKKVRRFGVLGLESLVVVGLLIGGIVSSGLDAFFNTSVDFLYYQALFALYVGSLAYLLSPPKARSALDVLAVPSPSPSLGTSFQGTTGAAAGTLISSI